MDERHLADDEDFDVRGPEEDIVSTPLNIKMPEPKIWVCPKGHRLLAAENHFTVMVATIGETITSRACPACMANYINEAFPGLELEEKKE